MCGRFNLHTAPQAWVQTLLPGIQTDALPTIPPRFNIAPTQSIPVVCELPATIDPAANPQPWCQSVLHNRRREFRPMRWGLIPSWAKDLTIGVKMINARSETAHEKTSFRRPLDQRRCLIPANGYYEWRREGSSKQAFHIHPTTGTVLWMAGLWERHPTLGVDGIPLYSCTVLTRSAHPSVSDVHDRMPVLVPAAFQEIWLSEESNGRQVLDHVLSQPDLDWQVEPVTPYVNNARNEGPECVQPANAPANDH